jgi:aconitate hydratase
VYLRDIWPTHAEVQALKASCVTPEQFRSQYANVFTGNQKWNSVPVSMSELYRWSEASTYIQNPPFFEGMRAEPPAAATISGARCLVFVTDHISPAGDIAEHSPAGEYLKSRGVRKADFNSYGSRRGNDRVMTRGTFANVRVRNKLALDPANGKVREGGWTRDFSKAGGGRIDWIYNAAMNSKKEGTPLVVLAGKDYGMGSSRDWAAKGTLLLGVRAVISESFERIHRSNLVGMGVLPLNFRAGEAAESLGLSGEETFDITLPEPLEPRCDVLVTATKPGGEVVRFTTVCRIDTPIEVEYYRNGGILQTVIRKKLNESRRTVSV